MKPVKKEKLFLVCTDDKEYISDTPDVDIDVGTVTEVSLVRNQALSDQQAYENSIEGLPEKCELLGGKELVFNSDDLSNTWNDMREIAIVLLGKRDGRISNFKSAIDALEKSYITTKQELQALKSNKPSVGEIINKIKKYCSICNGTGKEICDNPDHGFISAMPGDIGRLGCPCCGHDEDHAIPNSVCEQCKNIAQTIHDYKRGEV